MITYRVDRVRTDGIPLRVGIAFGEDLASVLPFAQPPHCRLMVWDESTGMYVPYVAGVAK